MSGLFSAGHFPYGSLKNRRDIFAVPGQFSTVNNGNFSSELMEQRMLGMSAMCTKVKYKLHEDGNTVSMFCAVPGDKHIPHIGSEFRLSELWEQVYEGIPEWFPLPGRHMFVFNDQNTMKKPKWRGGKESDGRVIECEAMLSEDQKVMLCKAKTDSNEVIEQSYRL